MKECLDTGWVSSVGAYVERFERDLAAHLGRQHAVAVVNGTAALHTALLVAGVQPNDDVLVSTLTFIAPVNAIRYVGAWPVFVDAEPSYWQIDPELVRRFLVRECTVEGGVPVNRRTGRRIGAIVPVDILGHPVDLGSIMEIAHEFGVPVVEDASECLGALYRRQPVGSQADISCFSFNGNKIITTGGGGTIVTNRSDWAARARYLTTQAKDDPVEYIHNEIGFNYRLTNVLAAIGCAQLEQLADFVAAKRAIAARYSRLFAGVPGITAMQEAPWAHSTFWLYTILVDSANAGIDSRALMHRLAANGIQTRPLWKPVHLNAPYRGLAVGDFPVAESLYQRALSLPCSVGLAERDLSAVATAVQQALAVPSPIHR